MEPLTAEKWQELYPGITEAEIQTADGLLAARMTPLVHRRDALSSLEQACNSYVEYLKTKYPKS